MAQTGLQLDWETFSCSICLELLRDPVTLACGHSYCMECINSHWDGEDEKHIHSCPQCRQSFTPRPVLERNNIIAAVVEQLEKTEIQKERKERQRELELSRLNIQQKVQDREKDVKLLRQEVKDLNNSAGETLRSSKKLFSEMMRLLEQRERDVEQQVRSQHQTEVSRVKDLQAQMEQEITELKKRDAELEQLSHTQDHIQFLLSCSSLAPLRESAASSSISIRPLRHFEDVTAAVSQLRDRLQDLLSDKWTNISLAVADVDALLSPPPTEPRTREDFLKYACELTLDPNTAHRELLLSEESRRATLTDQVQSYPDHPDRFTDDWQVLSRESLTGRSYWEVEWTETGVEVAVTYKTITRSGDNQQCGLGLNDKSWSLYCSTDHYKFYHNNIRTFISGSQSSRVGVYLDHRAGVLSFYSVSEAMTLLHRVQTCFTQPLHAGLGIWNDEATAEFCHFKQSSRR